MEEKRQLFGETSIRRRSLEIGLPAEPGVNGGLTPIRTLIVFVAIIGCFGVVYPRFIHPLLKNAISARVPAVKDSLEDKFLPPRLQNRPGPPELRPSGIRDRPTHHPGARFTGEHSIPESKGSLYLLPLYTVGIIGFLLYTFYKVISKSSQPQQMTRPERIRYSATEQKFTANIPTLPQKDRTVLNPEATEARKVSEFELKQLEEKLAQTEAQMNTLLLQMAALETIKSQQSKLEQTGESGFVHAVNKEDSAGSGADEESDLDDDGDNGHNQKYESGYETVGMNHDRHTDEAHQPEESEELWGDENPIERPMENELTQRKGHKYSLQDDS